MDSEDQLKDTEKVMMCDNYCHPVIQPEIYENGGNCPDCNEKFQPFNNSSE